jgi:hypothetical protein
VTIGRAPLAVALLLAIPAAAPAKTATFSGACQFAGPITPNPPITVAPQSGAHFSYRGSGTCKGTITGPITVTFTNVSTLFDTCELGPDIDLHGAATIGSGPRRAGFKITINLARLAVTGPFALTTTGGGRAAGVAQFQPVNESTAPQQCISGGINSASLAASFQTSSPLVGTADPVRPPRKPGRRARKLARDRQQICRSCSQRAS